MQQEDVFGKFVTHETHDYLCECGKWRHEHDFFSDECMCCMSFQQLLTYVIMWPWYLIKWMFKYGR